MITYMIHVLLVNSVLAKSFNALDYYTAPPYTQSEDAFIRATQYLEQNLPQEVRNATESQARKYYAFATVVKVASALAFTIRPIEPLQRYDPITILHNSLPLQWEEYDIITNATRDLISEAYMKIEPITKIIKTRCNLKTDIEACNEKVAIIIKSGDSDIKKRAELLLQLGNASGYILSYSNLLNVIIDDNKEISYMKHHVQDPSVTRMMKSFAAAHSLLKKIHQRNVTA